MHKENKKGKILRLKKGYNPNSSSIGSIVFSLPTMLLISSAVFGTATTIIFSKYLNKADNKEAGLNEAVDEENME